MNASRLFQASCVALIVTAMSFILRGAAMGAWTSEFHLTNEQVGWISSRRSGRLESRETGSTYSSRSSATCARCVVTSALPWWGDTAHAMMTTLAGWAHSHRSPSRER